eukprot:COSAG01_NODE_1902_length_8963_cov_29.997405_3_plen_231_part_00
MVAALHCCILVGRCRVLGLTCPLPPRLHTGRRFALLPSSPPHAVISAVSQLLRPMVASSAVVVLHHSCGERPFARSASACIPHCTWHHHSREARGSSGTCTHSTASESDPQRGSAIGSQPRKLSEPPHPADLPAEPCASNCLGHPSAPASSAHAPQRPSTRWRTNAEWAWASVRGRSTSPPAPTGQTCCRGYYAAYELVQCTAASARPPAAPTICLLQLYMHDVATAALQ